MRTGCEQTNKKTVLYERFFCCAVLLDDHPAARFTFHQGTAFDPGKDG